MRTWLLVITILFSAASALAQGNVSRTGDNGFTGNNTMSKFNNVIYVDGVNGRYPKTDVGIRNAITDALLAGSAASVQLTPGTYAIASTISISSGPLVVACQGATGQEQASPTPCVLNATAGLGANPIINISSADGTTLNNLTFNNSGTATYGVFLQNTQYAWINNVTCINPTATFATAFIGTATGGQANYQIHVVNPNIQATGPVGIQIDRTNIFSINHGAFINHTTANITVGLTTADTQIVIDQGTDFGQAMGGGATAMGVKVGTVNGLHIKDSYCETAQSGAQTGQLCVQFVSASQSTATLDSNYFAGNGISNYGMQLNGLINLTLSGVNAFSGFVTNGINNISNSSVIALGNNPVDTLNFVPVWDSLTGVAFRQDAATTSIPFTINTGLSETGTAGFAAIGTPSAPTLSGPGSSGGGTTYTYFCVAEDAGGLKTLASAQGQTMVGLATLSSINFIAVHCPGQAGAYAYDILKTDTAHRLGRVVVQYAGVGPTLNDTGQGTTAFTAAGRDQTGDLNIANGVLNLTAGTVNTVYGAPTVGQGVAAVFCDTRQKTETGADAALLTCGTTSLPTAIGTYRVQFIMSVSAANAATLGWTLTWTDSNGTAQTPTNFPLYQCLAANCTATPALTFTTSATGNYYGSAIIDVNNALANIVVKITFSGTSYTAKASASVERII